MTCFVIAISCPLPQYFQRNRSARMDLLLTHRQCNWNVMIPVPFAHFVQGPYFNEAVCNEIQAATSAYEDIFSTEKKVKARWVGHAVRSSGLCKTCCQGHYRGKGKGEDNGKYDTIRSKYWTCLDVNSSHRATEDRQQ